MSSYSPNASIASVAATLTSAMSTSSSCPICYGDIEDARFVECNRCHSRYHEECWNEYMKEKKEHRCAYCTQTVFRDINDINKMIEDLLKERTHFVNEIVCFLSFCTKLAERLPVAETRFEGVNTSAILLYTIEAMRLRGKLETDFEIFKFDAFEAPDLDIVLFVSRAINNALFVYSRNPIATNKITLVRAIERSNISLAQNDDSAFTYTDFKLIYKAFTGREYIRGETVKLAELETLNYRDVWKTAQMKSLIKRKIDFYSRIPSVSFVQLHSEIKIQPVHLCINCGEIVVSYKDGEISNYYNKCTNCSSLYCKYCRRPRGGIGVMDSCNCNRNAFRLADGNLLSKLFEETITNSDDYYEIPNTLKTDEEPCLLCKMMSKLVKFKVDWSTNSHRVCDYVRNEDERIDDCVTRHQIDDDNGYYCSLCHRAYYIQHLINKNDEDEDYYVQPDNQAFMNRNTELDKIKEIGFRVYRLDVPFEYIDEEMLLDKAFVKRMFKFNSKLFARIIEAYRPQLNRLADIYSQQLDNRTLLREVMLDISNYELYTLAHFKNPSSLTTKTKLALSRYITFKEFKEEFIKLILGYENRSLERYQVDIQEIEGILKK